MIWIAVLDPQHENHNQANQILKKLLNNKGASPIVLSDYVFSEIMSYITRRQKKKKCTQTEREKFVNQVYTSIYYSRYVKILKVSEVDIGTSFEYMRKNPSIVASLSDWLSLILMVRHTIPVIQTLDQDFGTIVSQIPEFNGLQVWDS
jgi:predicted nucleic acid-binding protein